jgi:hypothetical protein
MVETVLVAPILLLVLLGLIETGNALSVKHKMATLSREGANIASRGTSLAETLNVLMDSGDEINLRENGGIVVTRITVVDGDPVVDSRAATPGFEAASRLWNPGADDNIVAPLQALNLVDGQVLHAVEIIFNYEAMTPVGNFLPGGWTDEVYERAIF